MASEYTLRSPFTRQQLAQFLKTPELIKAFESLSTDVAVILPANEAEITRTARMALALAAQALIQSTDIPVEDAQIVPGPRGPAGADGITRFLVEPAPDDDLPMMRGNSQAVPVTGSRASGAALVSLLAALVAQGVIVDNTTA